MKKATSVRSIVHGIDVKNVDPRIKTVKKRNFMEKRKKTFKSFE